MAESRIGGWLVEAWNRRDAAGKKRTIVDGDEYITANPPLLRLSRPITIDTIAIGNGTAGVGVNGMVIPRGIYRLEIDGSELRFVQIKADVE